MAKKPRFSPVFTPSLKLACNIAYLQKEKDSEVDEGDDDDRDEELEETGENCVPATQHSKPCHSFHSQNIPFSLPSNQRWKNCINSTFKTLSIFSFSKSSSGGRIV